MLFIAIIAVELEKVRTADLTLFLVEEPEAHLHPQLQAAVLSFLQDQAEQSRLNPPADHGPAGELQVVVATHSPNLSACVSSDRLVVFKSEISATDGSGRAQHEPTSLNTSTIENGLNLEVVPTAKRAPSRWSGRLSRSAPRSSGRRSGVIGRGDYHWQHEPFWYTVRTKGNWTGDRKQTTLWTIGSGGQDTDTVHGTQKPVECMRRPIVNNTDFGQAVYEPFLGSGTTLIAAETTGRICYAMEFDPCYVDVAVRRWQAFTGKHAVHVANGRRFDDIAQTDLSQPETASEVADIGEKGAGP